VNQEDQDWIAEAYDQAPRRDEDLFSEESKSEADAHDYGFEDSEMEYENTDTNLEGTNGETIQASYGRALVSKDNGIGIYSTESVDDKMEYYGKLDLHTEHKATNLKFYDNEMKLLYQDQDKKKINLFDMQTEKVVETWEADGNREITHFTGETKNSQFGNEDTFYACTSKGIMLMDPRVSSN